MNNGVVTKDYYVKSLTFLRFSVLRQLSRHSLVLLLALLVLSGCKELKSELEKRARANSLRKPKPQTTLDKTGCPPGLLPRGKVDAQGRPEFCESPKYDGTSTELIGEDWPNKKPKVRYLLQGELLKVSRFYQDGNPKSEKFFLNNAKQGSSMEWYRRRTLKEKGNFHADKEHGVFERYHPNGKYKEVGTYVQGLKHGTWTYFDKSGRVKSRAEYRQDVRHGNAEFFDVTGARVSHGTYGNGKKDGRWVQYFADKTKKSAGTYRLGMKEGKWVSYFPNGKVQAVTYFKQDKPVPKQTLRGTVAFRQGDILGARPPVSRSNPPQKAARKSENKRRPMTKGKGWRPL